MAALPPPAAAASWRKLRIGMPRDDVYDAVIVGGGIGGVAAARRLLEAGKRVCLLEAQDRWGGRTKLARSSAVPGVTVDVGGQWVGRRLPSAAAPPCCALLFVPWRARHSPARASGACSCATT